MGRPAGGRPPPRCEYLIHACISYLRSHEDALEVLFGCLSVSGVSALEDEVEDVKRGCATSVCCCLCA